MRMVIAAVVAMMISAAMADELDDAHRLAVAGRDSYWKCLAREYSRDSNKRMSGEDFASHLASVCASERQNFRVALMGYLSMQSLGTDAGAHHGQQRHRTGPKGYRDGFYQAQGFVEVATAFAGVPALFLGRDFP
jgi:hypothetical protein